MQRHPDGDLPPLIAPLPDGSMAPFSLAVARRAREMAQRRDALAHAQRLAQHAFAVTIAGSALPLARLAQSAVSRGSGPCTALGVGGGYAPGDAAFLNALAGHVSLLEDAGPGGRREGTHPGTYVFPAALAIVEARGGSGADLLRALVTGYEAVSLVALPTPEVVFQRGMRGVPLLGPFGAAAAAAAALGASAEQIASALGFASNVAGGHNEGFAGFGMEPFLHPAFAARNGVLAAQLALAGCPAAPRSLEGRQGFYASIGDGTPLSSFAPFGDEPAVARVGTKRFATCLYNQGTLALIREHWPEGLDISRIARVTLRRPASGPHGLHAPGVAALPPYPNALMRQMSARYTAAAALAGRAVESADAYQATDPALETLAHRIELADSSDDVVAIEIGMHDGQVHRAHRAPGPALVFSGDETLADATRRVRESLGDRGDAAADLVARWGSLDRVDRLTRLTHRPPG